MLLKCQKGKLAKRIVYTARHLTRTHTHMHARTQACMHAHKHAHTHTRTHAHTPTSTGNIRSKPNSFRSVGNNKISLLLSLRAAGCVLLLEDAVDQGGLACQARAVYRDGDGACRLGEVELSLVKANEHS